VCSILLPLYLYSPHNYRCPYLNRHILQPVLSTATMSKEYEGRDPLEIAKAAERDLAGSRGQASDSTKVRLLIASFSSH